MDIEAIKQLANDINNVAAASFQSGKEHIEQPLLARIKLLESLLKESLDLYFDYSNATDFDEWVEKVKEVLKG